MSLFSKQQYIWLASFFRDELNRAKILDKPENKNIYEKYQIRTEYLNSLISNLGKELEQTSPTFNRERFEKAIYFQTEEEKKDEIRKRYSDPEMTGDGLSKYDYEL